VLVLWGKRLPESHEVTVGRCEMRCKRCHGLVVVDAFIDGGLDERLSGLGGWRCINCGEWLDIGVLRNRAANRSKRNQVAECQSDNSDLPMHYRAMVSS
jgi:hypothetical protein